MKRGSKGFFAPVLFSLICLPIVSAVLLGIRWKKAGLEDRNQPLLNFVAAIFLVFGSLSILLAFVPTSDARERAFELQDQGYSYEQIDSMATIENTEGNKVIDPATYDRQFDRNLRIGFLIIWSGLPCIVCGIFLLMIRKKLNQLNESITMVVNLIQAGENNLDELQSHFPTSIDPLEMGKEIVKFNLLPNYVVDFKTRRILSKGMHRVENKLRTVTWVCSSCNAKNSVQTKGTETPVCEFCNTPKV